MKDSLQETNSRQLAHCADKIQTFKLLIQLLATSQTGNSDSCEMAWA